MHEMVGFTRGFIWKGCLSLLVLMFLVSDPRFFLPTDIGIPEHWFTQPLIYYAVDFFPIAFILGIVGLVVYMIKEYW